MNHLLSVELVTPDGEVLVIGDKTEDVNGYDLLGLVCGGEGTLGIVTKATIRLTERPESVETFLAVFDTVDSATLAVSTLISSGITPAALEMMDREILQTVEDAFQFGFPRDAAAILIVELDGDKSGLARQCETVKAICSALDARELRQARTPIERAEIWSARKKAIGTLGRTATGIVTQDGVIPRSKLPEVLRTIGEIGSRYSLRIANVFHAGDGNLHPCIVFDPELPGEIAKVHSANREILELCIASGGTITGEHGVGLEKSEFMPQLYPASTLDTMTTIKLAFNENGLCNPGKILPDNHGCAFEFQVHNKGAAS